MQTQQMQHSFPSPKNYRIFRGPGRKLRVCGVVVLNKYLPRTVFAAQSVTRH